MVAKTRPPIQLSVQANILDVHSLFRRQVTLLNISLGRRHTRIPPSPSALFFHGVLFVYVRCRLGLRFFSLLSACYGVFKPMQRAQVLNHAYLLITRVVARPAFEVVYRNNEELCLFRSEPLLVDFLKVGLKVRDLDTAHRTANRWKRSTNPTPLNCRGLGVDVKQVLAQDIRGHPLEANRALCMRSPESEPLCRYWRGRACI